MKLRHVALSAVLLVHLSLALIPFLSSKTVYDASRGDIRNVEPLSNDIGRCTPVRIYFLLRHGSRNFGNTLTLRMTAFLDKLEGLVGSGDAVLPESMSWYKTWSRGSYFSDYEMVPEGMMEHYTIAERYKAAYPELFPRYSISNYSLQSTTKLRTVQSALSFMYGLLNGTGPLGSSVSRTDISMKGYMPPGLVIKKNDEDRLLRFVDVCPKYESYIESHEWKTENELFVESQEFQSALDSVSSAINFTLTLEDVKALYYLCAGEQMSPSQAHHSQFCNVFETSTLKIFDFWKDLEKYYKYSYPFPTTYKMSCLLLKDVIDNLGSPATTPILKFAHEETVVPLVTLLDLFDDGEILTHDTKDFVNRKMKVSHIAPFAGNIAFVKHTCPGDSKSRIQIIVNEEEITTSWCSYPGCTLTELETILAKRTDGCDYDDICDIVSAEPLQTIYIGIGALLTICIIQATYIFFHCIKRCPLRARAVSRDGQQLLINSSDNITMPLTRETQFGLTSNSESD